MNDILNLSYSVSKNTITQNYTLDISHTIWSNSYKDTEVLIAKIPFRKLPKKMQNLLIENYKNTKNGNWFKYGTRRDVDFLINIWPYGNDYSALIANRKNYDNFCTNPFRWIKNKFK